MKISCINPIKEFDTTKTYTPPKAMLGHPPNLNMLSNLNITLIYKSDRLHAYLLIVRYTI